MMSSSPRGRGVSLATTRRWTACQSVPWKPNRDQTSRGRWWSCQGDGSVRLSTGLELVVCPAAEDRPRPHPHPLHSPPLAPSSGQRIHHRCMERTPVATNHQPITCRAPPTTCQSPAFTSPSHVPLPPNTHHCTAQLTVVLMN